ncbi:MAG TPA: hypothetical protein VEI03_13515 [Stellaceae bacterium]|nr:hypothetical protein [Stellaceae bacterium]
MPVLRPWTCLAGALGKEPSLDEVLADPITRQLMASDGLRPDDVEGVLMDAVRRSKARPTAGG